MHTYEHNDRSSTSEGHGHHFHSLVNSADKNEMGHCHRKNDDQSTEKESSSVQLKDPYDQDSDLPKAHHHHHNHHGDHHHDLETLLGEQIEHLIEQLLQKIVSELIDAAEEANSADGGSESSTTGSESTGSESTSPESSEPESTENPAPSHTETGAAGHSEASAGNTESTSAHSSNTESTSDELPTSHTLPIVEITDAPAATTDAPAATTETPKGGSAAPSTSSGEIGGKPSWANIDTINANYNPSLSPADYAKPISSDANYLDVSIARPSALLYSEGIMVDERNMKPEDLRTVKVYEAGGDWTSNDTTGKLLGEIQIPKDAQFLRPITHFDSGITVADNNPVTFIQPDGRDMSFNKVLLDGDTMIGWQSAGAHAGSGEGNYGAMSKTETDQAIQNGTAPQHALQVVMSTEVLFKGGAGEPWYTGTDPNVQMGSHLALPKNLRPEDLGVTSDLGKAVFKTMQDYGAYIDDSIGGSLAGIEIEQGSRQAILSAGLEYQFQNEFNSMLAASKAVAGSSAIGH